MTKTEDLLDCESKYSKHELEESAINLVAKVWSYCDVLRDVGVGYGDYVEQITYLLFLKMADEMTKPPENRPAVIPKGFDWQSLLAEDGTALEKQYRHVLERLATEPGVIGLIYRKSQNKIRSPAHLRQLVELMNEQQWSGLGIDVKGEIYEGLLEKNAEDVKTGAGQYFTPRALIKAIVCVMMPEPGQTIHDPACGTGGFLLTAYDYIKNVYGAEMDVKQKKFLKESTFSAIDLVPDVVRLCMMNLFLHGVGDKKPLVQENDSLLSQPSNHYDMVLTNPPFGKKSSYTSIVDGKKVTESQQYERQDFWASTSNKQLNFLQHVRSALNINGTAAVVVPDNVLFEGGAGETVRKKLLETCDVHTLLRLPTGIFYAGGVKANVLFFDNRPASEEPQTTKVWIYDLRTNKHFTMKENTLKIRDLLDFVKCYNPKNREKRKETERFRSYTYDELIKRDKASLDILELKDESLIDLENLPEPHVIADEIADNLQSALDSVNELRENLKNK